MSTLYEAVTRHRSSGRDALYFGSRVISHREMAENIDRMVTYLRENGISPGDVVTLVLPNLPAALYAFYAIDAIGAAANILHPLTTTENILKAMKAVKSRFAFLLLTRCRDDCRMLDESGYRFFLVNPMNDANPLLRCALSMKYKIPRNTGKFLAADRFRRCRPARDIAPRNAAEGSIYLHSGGTTGTPKTIVLSDSAVNNLAEKIGTVPEGGIVGKTMLAALPIFHGFGLAVSVHAPLSLGAACLLMMKFDAGKVLRFIDKGRLNIIPGIPLLFRKLMEHPLFSKTDFRHLDLCFVGGDNVPPGLIRDFDAAMAAGKSACVMLEGYGLTETVSVCAVNTRLQRRPGSAGRPLPGISMEIRDDNGHPLPPASVGEVWVAGSTLMNGYLGEEQIDRQSFIPTGDLGCLDKEGFLWLKGRKKRVFKISGINVYPSEIEQLVCTHPRIINASLEFFPTPAPHTVLYLIKNPDANEDAILGDIRDLLHRNCLAYCLPRSIRFMDKFPETALGKIDHSGFRDMN